MPTSREDWLASLDPGVARYVDVLDAAGIETYESCEGGEGHSYAEPAVRFYGVRGEGFRALAVALQHGFPVRATRRIWTVDEDGHPHGPYWELAFWEPYRPSRASRLHSSHRGLLPSPFRRCLCCIRLPSAHTELS
jgi:hypothetical protein